MRNKTLRLALLVLSLTLAMSSPALAVVVFNDNFNTENGGVGVLNYTGFANWAVSDGAVDLIGSNGFFNFLPGNGLYIDMDGTNTPKDAGKLTSTINLAPGTYTLQFDLAGNHRNADEESVIVQIGNGTLFDQTYSLSQNDPFTTYTATFSFLGGDVSFSFEGVGGDNIGMLLDNVTLSVPEPYTLLLLGLGFAGLGTMGRWFRRS